MSLSPLPTIRKAQKIQGRTLIFRDAKQENAAFILGLRTDSQKSRYLSTTDADLGSKKNGLITMPSKLIKPISLLKVCKANL